MTAYAERAPAGQDLTLSDADFASIARIAKAEYGLHLEPSKRAMIRSRLGRRITALGLGGFSEYCNLVETGATDERDHFVSALTTNVTQFYREVHHFEYLEKNVLPDLIARARQGQRVRFWSAGCSSGQEPYSLAGSLLSLAPDIGRTDLRILATDLDPEVLARAEKASYRDDDCKCPDDSYAKRLFDIVGKAPATREIRPELRRLITFRRLNLNDSWPFSGRFDVIFCRNVVIYFDKPTQERLWQRFCELLEPGSHLLIGHSERVSGPALSQFESVGITTYRKTGTRTGPDIRMRN